MRQTVNEPRFMKGTFNFENKYVYAIFEQGLKLLFFFLAKHYTVAACVQSYCNVASDFELWFLSYLKVFVSSSSVLIDRFDLQIETYRLVLAQLFKSQPRSQN